ncbi:MAG: J domain-containing protein [Synergistaceae bacterium]|nr:J domain-containing protein [Synergistota bacterium]NLM72308.1 J domain-containing protein [Synergistaceae bacterium]
MGVTLELFECFDILGVQPGAHLKEIRSAFRRLALSCHPDVAGPGSAKEFETVAAAYARLKSATPTQVTESLKKKKAKAKGARRGASPYSRESSRDRGRSRSSRREKKAGDRSQRVSDLMLERALVDAELYFARIMEKAARSTDAPQSASLAVRLLSAHPAVRMLAIGALIKSSIDAAVLSALVEMVKRWPPDDDVIESLFMLNFSKAQKEAMLSALSAKIPLLSECSALALMRFASRSPAGALVYERMLSHSSHRVLASALPKWPRKEPPDDLTLIRLLKRDEDVVLVPLLRLLRARRIPAWAAARVKLLAEKHESPAVRVWAGSIVQAQNLV